MADFAIKAHDRIPSIQATLGDVGGTIPPLSGATVTFIMRSKTGSTPKVNAAAVIVNAATGVVRYDWAAADTDTPGSYQAEWQIVYSNGKKQTLPTLTYHTIDILADLDDA